MFFSPLDESNVLIFVQIEQQYENCLTDWRTLQRENERLGNEFDEIESKLKTINVKIDGQSPGERSMEKIRQMKNDFDLLESQLSTMERFALDLSHRTQETDLIEDFQTFHQRFQRSKILWKDLLRKTNENQLKFDIYSDEFRQFHRSIDELEEQLNEIQGELDRLTSGAPISLGTMEKLEKKFRDFSTTTNERNSTDKRARSTSQRRIFSIRWRILATFGSSLLLPLRRFVTLVLVAVMP